MPQIPHLQLIRAIYRKLKLQPANLGVSVELDVNGAVGRLAVASPRQGDLPSAQKQPARGC